jgi:hypothetical protein
MADVADPVKVFHCPGCRAEVDRPRYCKACRRGYQAHYRRRQRLAAVRKFAAAVNAADDFAEVRDLVRDMIKRIGGLEELGRLWAAAFKACHQADPGSYRTLRHLRALATMMQGLQANPAPPPDLSGLSEEDLTLVTEQSVINAIQHEPELVLAAAEQLGWKVTPPIDIRTIERAN